MDCKRFDWQLVPDLLKKTLLISSTDKVHLMEAAVKFLEHGLSRVDDCLFCYDLVADMLNFGWETEPLDGDLAKVLLTLHQKAPALSSSRVKLLRKLLALWDCPEEECYLWRTKKGDNVKFFLIDKLKNGSFYWRKHAAHFALHEKDEEVIQVLLSQVWPEELEFIPQVIKGDWALIHDNLDKAEVAYKKVIEHGLESFYFRLAKVMKLKGEEDKALLLMRKGLVRFPWQVSYWLALYDCLKGLNNMICPLSGQTGILLYTYNKADELDTTLNCLKQSELYDAKIFVLLNGCTDHTVDVASKWTDRFGPERLKIINLPVNVGAPAARNWLMHEPEVRQMDWVVYLDDDACVPPDWLGRFGVAVNAYPDAWVWGCKVVDAVNPYILQHGDIHLLPPSTGNEKNDNFKVYICSNVDRGEFDYIRPCASVTGCCHLFATEKLLESGLFDLRFSPSQYDDLEHDIRLCLKERQIVYQGHLRVRHFRRTGEASSLNPAQFANSYANLYKLQHKYSREEYSKIIQMNYQRLEEDFLSKWNEIYRFVFC